MNIYSQIRQLAKSIKSQNLFIAAKELSGIRLFRNLFDLSKLQEIYLSFLYMYDAINKDIIIENISKHVLDYELYEDAYMLWKKNKKTKKESNDNKQKDVNLVVGKGIKFPTEKV